MSLVVLVAIPPSRESNVSPSEGADYSIWGLPAWGPEEGGGLSVRRR